jgi:hypothetical protein
VRACVDDPVGDVCVPACICVCLSVSLALSQFYDSTTYIVCVCLSVCLEPGFRWKAKIAPKCRIREANQRSLHLQIYRLFFFCNISSHWLFDQSKYLLLEYSPKYTILNIFIKNVSPGFSICFFAQKCQEQRMQTTIFFFLSCHDIMHSHFLQIELWRWSAGH